MNIRQLKEYIKDLPDEMAVGVFDHDNQYDVMAESLIIKKGMYLEPEVEGDYLRIFG